MTEFKKILVAVDFSDTARRAVALAGDLAAKTGGAITLIHVGPHRVAYSMPGRLVTERDPHFSELREEELARQWRLLEELGASLGGVELQRLDGTAADQILKELDEGGHDLLVIGTHGREGLDRQILGSVAERVMRRAKVPVLVTH